MKARQTLRRSRSNDGTPSRISRVMPIRPELLAKLIAEFYQPIERRAPKLYHGPRPATGHGGAVVLSDEQVLQVRRMRHWYGMSLHQIAEALGMRETQIDGLVNYRNRVHLDPGPRPAHVEREIEAA